MLKSVEFMSLKAVKSVVPTNGVAVISIHDSSTARDLPTFSGFFDVLRVNMLDVCEEHVGLMPGAWSDEPTLEQHFQYCALSDNFVPSLSHAHAIRSFVDRLHAHTDRLDLLVHCSAGVSRSAGVACWAGQYLGVKLLDRANVGLGEANPRIIRLLNSLPRQ
ncbi:protein-tyrosine phosphatase family protein [Rhodoferax fermentans]|uniref:protein-tyrosine phosphatase family protein n=1 Tax=Rhodoferax fermentans TaxID=28066 RepID=UPI00117AD0A0|nr:protein-tyrosine phosphatase family protein [Rhodoferax fermentans]